MTQTVFRRQSWKCSLIALFSYIWLHPLPTLDLPTSIFYILYNIMIFFLTPLNAYNILYYPSIGTHLQ